MGNYTETFIDCYLRERGEKPPVELIEFWTLVDESKITLHELYDIISSSFSPTGRGIKQSKRFEHTEN